MIKFLITILVSSLIILSLTGVSMCQEKEQLIKVVNETDLVDNIIPDSKGKDNGIPLRRIETNFNSEALISNSNAAEEKSILLKDDPANYKDKAELYRKESIMLDRKKMGQELYLALPEAFKNCKTLKNIETRDYIIYFNVKSIQRDEYTGIVYPWEVEYRIEKEGKVLFEKHLLPPKKRIWFSNKEYHQLVEPKVIAKQIVDDLCKILT